MNTTTPFASRKSFEVASGSRVVRVTIDPDAGHPATARLYVNDGETATLLAWAGRTEAGAIQWAKKTLAA